MPRGRSRGARIRSRVRQVVSVIQRPKRAVTRRKARRHASKEQKKASRFAGIQHKMIQTGVFLATLVRHDGPKIRNAKGFDKLRVAGESVIDNAIAPRVGIQGINNEYTRTGAVMFAIGTAVRMVGRATRIPMPKAAGELSSLGGDFIKGGVIGGALTGGGPQSHTATNRRQEAVAGTVP